MQVIPQKIWTRQPGQATGVWWKNPIAKGLLFAWNGAAPWVDQSCWRRMTAGIGITNFSSSYLSARPGGKALVSSASGEGGILVSENANSTSSGAARYDIQFPLTVVALMRGNAALGNAGKFFGRMVGSAVPNWSIGLHAGSYNGGYYTLNNGTNTAGGDPGTDLWNPKNRTVLGTLSVGASTHSVWWDRLERRDTIANPAGGAIVYEYSGDSLNLQRKLCVGNNDSDNAIGSEVFAAFMWNRALSYEEHLELTDNPWQLFAPPPRARAYFLQGASATGHKFLGPTGRRLRTHDGKALRIA